MSPLPAPEPPPVPPEARLSPYPPNLAPPLPGPVLVPMSRMLRTASPVVQYRAGKAFFPAAAAEAGWSGVPYASRQGLHLLFMQEADGQWPGGMLTVPSGTSLQGVGTIPAYRRLLELGWDPESPALSATKRLLFRLLAEDDDPSFLAEMMPAEWDEDLIRRGRLLLREGAAAALAQAGYEADPRLRGAARRLVDRVMPFLKSPLAQKPWMRLGNQHVLGADAMAPSFHLLVMLGYMPHFRSEHHEFMDRLLVYLSQPWPRQQPVQQVGPHLLEQPHLVLGDLLPTRHVMDADMASSLGWLETMARIGFVKRHEGWGKLLDRLLDDRDRKHVWTPPRSVVMPERVPSWAWPLLPLSDPGFGEPADSAFSADVTFRLALIAQLCGREIELV
jgi:hypothetical protein